MGGEGGDVVGGAEEAEFFGRDPDEADGVVGAEVGELFGDLEEGDGAGAVVVDARPCADGVGMGCVDLFSCQLRKK